MRFQIREKVFSIGDKFTIKDQFGEDRYFARGKVFSLGNKLYLEDMQGNVLIYIEQKLFRLLPEYTLYKSDRPIAKVKRKFSLLRPKFEIESELGNFTVSGNYMAHEFFMINQTVIEHGCFTSYRFKCLFKCLCMRELCYRKMYT